MCGNKGCSLGFYKQKNREEGSQVQTSQLVKTFVNAEVSAINDELKNSCKEKKIYQIGLPSEVKDEAGKYAHKYGTQAGITYFRGKHFTTYSRQQLEA